MRFLLDSHVVIWWADDFSQLSSKVDGLLRDPANELFISVGTVWEISIKVGYGKLKLGTGLGDWFTRTAATLKARWVPIEIEHAHIQSTLALIHRDPFDRMLAAQSIAADLTLISKDTVFDAYGVPRVW